MFPAVRLEGAVGCFFSCASIKNENHHEMTLGWLESENGSDMQMLDTKMLFFYLLVFTIFKGNHNFQASL